MAPVPMQDIEGEDEIVSINGADPEFKAGGKPSAAADDDIEIVDDTPEKDRGRKPLGHAVEDPDDAELATYSAGVKKRFSELTHARHDERRRADAAERERDEAVRAAQSLLNQNKQLAQRTINGETHLVAASKAAATAKLEKARADLKAAKEAFDPDAELVAQELMMEAKLQLQKIDDFRPAPVQKPEQVVQLPAVSDPEDPVDQKTLRWQAKNQWFGTAGNEDKTGFALGFHKQLVESGVDPRSDEYFQKVDERLRAVFPDFFGGEPGNGSETARSTQRTTARTSPVASASRSANGVTKVRLTPTQIALAKRFGLTPQQYAQEVVRLEQK